MFATTCIITDFHKSTGGIAMAHKKTTEQISYNMSRVRNTNTALESVFEKELRKRGFSTFEKNKNGIPGKPDFVFNARKVAVFCDGDYWHGYNWNSKKNDIKSNQNFWIKKIENNIVHDHNVNMALAELGWTVFRFWGHEINKDVAACVNRVEAHIRIIPHAPYRTIDLCAGIGGIRRGFELSGNFENVLSAEIDKYACLTYQHLFGDDPNNDLTSEDFKKSVEQTSYDILLAGFPCQTFSRSGKEEGFEEQTKGQIFFHIADIIKRTRPAVIFLENVDHLVTHDGGNTFRTITDTLVNELGYHIIGVTRNDNGELAYNGKSFIRNSREFGVPQNRPRTYIIGFDTEIFSPETISEFPNELPLNRENPIYHDLNDVLDDDIVPKYYMASGYFETLVRHRIRQKANGNGFGYRIVNSQEIQHPIANTLLATGGSGKERNLIYDPRDGIAGLIVKGKKTPLNNQGIRVMTPNEWGKLQGFVNYAFLDEDGVDHFSFPDGISDVQKYKQFGNSVTVPVIERMAEFVIRCLNQ
jgi:DNA (cytosine-5)-methyltransferase 1